MNTEHATTEPVIKQRTKHELKIWPKYFSAVKSGKKTYEIRVPDRVYSNGDLCLLQEWDPETKEYTQHELLFEIGFVFQTSKEYGQLVVFSLLPVT